jgi:hypothetical protein
MEKAAAVAKEKAVTVASAQYRPMGTAAARPRVSAPQYTEVMSAPVCGLAPKERMLL